MEIKQQKSFSGFYQGKRILITGASGYIAWNLIKRLVEYNCTLVCFSGNTKNIEQQSGNANFEIIEANYHDENAFKKAVTNVDVIYHLASQTSIYKAEQNPLKDFEANVRPMQLLLNALMAVMMVVVAWRVWIIADFMADYGDATEFLAIPYAPITHFIAVMTGLAGIAFVCNVARYWVRRA